MSVGSAITSTRQTTPRRTVAYRSPPIPRSARRSDADSRSGADIVPFSAERSPPAVRLLAAQDRVADDHGREDHDPRDDERRPAHL